ncbi:MAG: ATP-binding protein [Isosphaeraceae bacterium]
MSELSGIVNPFRVTIVSDPWRPSPPDVPEIHAKAFQTCCNALESVRRQWGSSSVLIHGEPGSGKTHLLARLRQYCRDVEPRVLDPLQPETVFVAVRLQTGPQRLWRHLRRNFVEDLLREAPDSTPQLKRILLRRLGSLCHTDADLLVWWECLKQEYPDPALLKALLDSYLDRLSGELQLSRDFCTVLVRFMMGRHLRDTRAWLMGDPLPDSALAALDVAAPAEDDDFEEQAQRVVLDLCHLAGSRIPIVLCFDQIEALMSHPEDRGAIGTLGQVIMRLFNETTNLVLISCVQSTYVDYLNLYNPEGALRPAGARMAVHQTSLGPLDWDNAFRLVQARMAGERRLAELRTAKGDPLWPLDKSRLEKTVGLRGCTPRKILSVCAELFDAVSDRRVVPTISDKAFVSRIWQERLDVASSGDTLAQMDHILTHGIPLLVHAAAEGWNSNGKSPSRDLEVFLEGDGRIGVSLCNHRDMRSLLPRLKRLRQVLPDRRAEKLVLLRDVRLPLGKNAIRTNQMLDELNTQGARLIRPSHELLAALDALRRLLSDAKAGDLSNQGQTVTPETVQKWLAENMPGVLRDLLDEIVAYPVPSDNGDDGRLFDELLEVLAEHPVIALDEAAGTLKTDTGTLEATANARASDVGILRGPPVVLFRLTADEVVPEAV